MAEQGEAEAEAGEGLSGSGPGVGIALAEARRRRGKADEVDAFLKDQRGLIADQRHHLAEQLTSIRLKRFSDRLRIVFELFGALAATAVALFIAGLVWQAAHDRRLVVEAFSTPPDLAARGVTGRVLAARLLDGLAQINAQASSSRAPTDYAANWGEEAKVEIPETGVSIGELQRFLAGWLGHETHISGDLVRTADGRLSLTVRSGDRPGRTYEGAEADLPAMMKQAAEGAFEATQPYRYSVYLLTQGRTDQSLKVAQALAEADVPRREKAWAWTQLSNIYINQLEATQAIAAGQRAIGLDPNVPVAFFNLGSGWYALGREEEALRFYREGIASLKRPLPDVSSFATAYFVPANEAAIADQMGDFQEAARSMAIVLEMTDMEGFRPALAFGHAFELARNHDISGSRRVAVGPGGDGVGAMHLGDWGEAFVPDYERAAALDDWAAAAAAMRSTIDAVPKTPQVKTTLVDRFLAPRLALALGRSGDQAAAESLAASLPQDCYRCLVARGAVASLGRYWRRAEAEFAAAERLAPSLPAAWLAAGQSRVMRGDRVGAQQAFAQAVKLGPHFADALEAWGESLMAGGDADGAGAKYAEAAKYAPRWGRLRLRWGQALAKQGKRDEARAQFQAAAGMDLSVADRAELNAQKL